MIKSDCNSCNPCDLVSDINRSLIRIADARLYNIRYELDRPVDYYMYKMLKFYKPIAQEICDGTDCGCYSGGVEPPCKPKESCEEPKVLNTNQNIIERIRIICSY